VNAPLKAACLVAAMAAGADRLPRGSRRRATARRDLLDALPRQKAIVQSPPLASPRLTGISQSLNAETPWL
jgi:hypothetical protein